MLNILKVIYISIIYINLSKILLKECCVILAYGENKIVICPCLKFAAKKVTIIILEIYQDN